jgi:hypothetical protein
MEVKMKIDLTGNELENLKAFLSRVDLKGAEVPAYIEIQMKLNNPSIDEKASDVEDVK